MSQAEIAAGRVTLPGEMPAKGRRFPDFELTAASGHQVRLSDYRGRSSLVLVFADDQRTMADLLIEMARLYERFKEEESEIIVVEQCARDECARIKEQLKLPFLMLSDGDGHIHREVGASDERGRTAAAVYVTDRYGEVFAVYRTSDGQKLPRASDLLEWLEFVNSQCPECEPPEWPA